MSGAFEVWRQRVPREHAREPLFRRSEGMAINKGYPSSLEESEISLY
jgi:hypothetical protein